MTRSRPFISWRCAVAETLRKMVPGSFCQIGAATHFLAEGKDAESEGSAGTCEQQQSCAVRIRLRTSRWGCPSPAQQGPRSPNLSRVAPNLLWNPLALFRNLRTNTPEKALRTWKNTMNQSTVATSASGI